MLPAHLLDDWLRMALGEDLGTGDVTSEILIPPDLWGRAEILAKESFLVAGLEVAFQVFEILSPSIEGSFKSLDGMTVEKGTVLLEVEGPLGALLSGERVALNILQHLSGVATLARRFVDAVAGTGVKILDTRKTLPGMRVLEKQAVRIGGGSNHRASLSEGVLIKENHILACGGIREAVQKMKASAPHLLRVEVEASSLEEVREALDAGADVILLDNMTAETVREVVPLVKGAVPLEVSGGVTLDNVRSMAETGVQGISVGRITHSAPSVDISMMVRETWTRTTGTTG